MGKIFSVRAVVDSVEGKNPKRYAVTRLDEPPPQHSELARTAVVTFSLSEWQGANEPTSGQLVVLSDIEKFKKGWRARRAKPIRA